ncbi:MAG: hypothetical protein WC659_05260 [Patescibacteria group bacterium]
MSHAPARHFAHHLIHHGGLHVLGHTYTHEYKEKLADQLSRRVGLKAIQMLDDNGREEYMKFSSKFARKDPTPKQAFDFFRKRIPDFEKKLGQVVSDIIRDFFESHAKFVG